MEIKRLLALLWRWVWLIVVITAVFTGTAYLFNITRTPIYQAASRLLIDEAPGAGSGNDYSQILLEERLAQTYVQIINTRAVLQETIVQLELPMTTTQLAGKVNVASLPDTQIIVITVQDSDAERAAAIANQLGEVFISQNQARERSRYAELIANWERRLVEIGDEVEALETELNSFGSSAAAADAAALSRLQLQRNEAQIRYTEAFNNLNELQVDQARNSSNVVQIEQAEPNFNPISPNVTRNSLLAAVAGILLSVALILLIDYLDDTVKTSAHITEDTTLSTLGAITHIKGEHYAARLVTSRAPRDPISEAYRVLRTNLNFAAVNSGLTSVLITSSSPGEGKSTTAANLAVVLAQSGKKVILIDADLRRPVQHKIFEVVNNQGLTTAILDQRTPATFHLQKTRWPVLQLMTSGPLAPNPSELLNAPRMAQIIAELQEGCDTLLFDSPPTLTVADASILAPQVAGTLFVVEVGKTRRDTLIQAVAQIVNTNATILGVSFNRVKLNRNGYYEAYYHQYNSAYLSKKRPFFGRVPNWLGGLIRR